MPKKRSKSLSSDYSGNAANKISVYDQYEGIIRSLTKKEGSSYSFNHKRYEEIKVNNIMLPCLQSVYERHFTIPNILVLVPGSIIVITYLLDLIKS
jgi:hypothetical protein